MDTRSVYILHHEYERWGRDYPKLIGVYETREDAEAAILRLRDQPGFRDWPDGFTVDEYALGEDHWTEGFSTIVSIHVEVVGQDPPQWECLHAEWQPGDTFLIIDTDAGHEDERWAFKPGQVVRCEERTIDGNPNCLVAVALAGSSA
jgi:hypothetical protein